MQCLAESKQAKVVSEINETQGLKSYYGMDAIKTKPTRDTKRNCQPSGAYSLITMLHDSCRLPDL